MEINKLKHIHFVGIKGVGMASLAMMAYEMGKKVTGSDIPDKFVTDKVLQEMKIEIFEEFNGKKYKELLLKYGADELLVITTGAHQGFYNPEVKYALEQGFKVVSHAQALGLLSGKKITVAVSGTHGKSTTTAMIASVLVEGNYDPSYIVGVGKICSAVISNPGHYGKGEHFIVEADEYVTDPQTDSTPRFAWLNPKILVMTSVEYDHPDVYTDVSKLIQEFKKLAEKVPVDGSIIACIDNIGVEKALKGSNAKILWYGYSPRAGYRIKSFRNSVSVVNREYSIFSIYHQGREMFEVNLGVPGRHNALNAVATILACTQVGMSWKDILPALVDFSGTGRRFELIRHIGDTVLYDDYAHHPTEIKAVLSMAKELYPDYNIVVVFQPHTYSRTKALFNDFANSFIDADEVYLLDIFSSAREKIDLSVSSGELAREANKHGARVIYMPSVLKLVDILKSKLGNRQVIITMGAGDVYKLHDKLEV